MARLVFHDGEDKFGNTCLIVRGHHTVQEIYNELFQQYPDYSFLIPIDQNGGEWHDMKEIFVYFKADLFDEVAQEVGKESVNRWLMERGGCRCETCEYYRTERNADWTVSHICDNLKSNRIHPSFVCSHWQTARNRREP